MRRPSAAAALLASLAALSTAAASCGKVPIYDVNAGFTLADASWFKEEETLFVFYEVFAEQGLGENSVVEITYATDEERVDWTPIAELPAVHAHLPVDCGADGRCGSTSLRVPLEPRQVGIRLRYHRDGELALDSPTVFNAVGPGDPHSHRSLLVYGVFGEDNQRIQWRSRNQFPTVRNEQATDLGLRRDFSVFDRRFGTAEIATDDNPYGYGEKCPASFVPADLPDAQTDARAVFDAEDLPLEASEHAAVCAESTVTDATGTFTTTAVARKNPEVRAAFPVLRSPIRDATPIRFFLGPCDDVISAEHEEMQRQRLQLGNTPTYCIDDWESPSFEDELARAFSDAVEAARPAGDDMVLVVALNQDEGPISETVERALAQVVPAERHRSSPRLAGAFVFDSVERDLATDELRSSTIWCPAALSLSGDISLSDLSSLGCSVAPDIPDLELGPFSFGMIPILPAREDYLDFIDTYSEDQAGEVTKLTLRAPEFAVTSDHVDFGEFGVVTFLNNELISADLDDAFSYCPDQTSHFFAFRSPVMQSDAFQLLVENKCDETDLSEELCQAAALGVLPIEWIGQWHAIFGEESYEVGLFWDFPYLLSMEYEMVVAGSVSAFGLSVPFGFVSPGETYLGTAMWTTEEFPLDKTLTQCRRFCDHPTFDSAGVYHVSDPFRSTYAEDCYLPDYPELGDSGFPLDP